MTSIFPSVTVAIIRPLNAVQKPVPQLQVGLVGPMFKRISETATNGYAIEPETAPSIPVNINNVSDSQYIDYDSVEVDLVVNATDEVVKLNNKDTEVMPAYEVVKTGLEISNTYGFYKAKAVDSDFIFYPTTGAATVYGAVPGDWLYRLLPDASEVFQKIKQVTPVKLSKSAFPAPASSSDAGATFVYTFADGDDLTDTSDTIFAQHQWLIAIKKLDKSVVYQYHINAVDNTAPGKTITVDDDITSDALIATGDIPDYDWYVYDMPFGSLRMFAGSAPSSETTTSTSKYSVLSYALRTTTQGGSSGYFGRFANPTTGIYIFLPDARNQVVYGSTKIGDYLQATDRDNPDVYYRFRITKVGSSVLKSNLNTPDSFSTDTYTFPTGTTINTGEYVVNKSYLIAQLKTNSKIFRAYKITAWNDGTYELTVDNTDFSTDGAGANNAYLSASLSDYNWFIYDMPPSSLLVNVTTTSDFTNTSGSNSPDFDFSIVNAADYYVSGEKEVTIMNHISDANGDEIGLADVKFTYNVLETENAGVMMDVRSQSDREAYSGIVADYNPLGLASGLVEINTVYAYKIFPVNLALEERDPDNPKLYTGRYMPGEVNENYHNVANLDWIGIKEVIDSIKDTQIPYYLVPLSNDDSVVGMFNSAVHVWDDPERAKEMLLFATTTLPESKTIASNINPVEADFTISDGKLRWKPTTEWVSADDPAKSINFLSLGVKKNDYMSFTDSVSGDEVLIKIINVYASYFDLGTSDYDTVGDLITAIDSTDRITIKKLYQNKADIVEALVKKAEAFNSFRVKLIWGDRIDLNIEGTEFISVPMYYGAAAYAAMANYAGTVVPKTYRTINGISKVYHVTPYLSDTDLETLGSGFVDILTQDFDGGAVYSKRQFMTDGSELSGIEPVDEYAKQLRSVFRRLIGRYNINDSLFDLLGLTLSGTIDQFKPAKFQDIQILQGFRLSGVKKDRVSLKLRPVPYSPFNGLDIELFL